VEKPGNIQEPKDGEHGRMVTQCIDMRFTKGHGVEFSKENIPDEITLLFGANQQTRLYLLSVDSLPKKNYGRSTYPTLNDQPINPSVDYVIYDPLSSGRGIKGLRIGEEVKISRDYEHGGELVFPELRNDETIPDEGDYFRASLGEDGRLILQFLQEPYGSIQYDIPEEKAFGWGKLESHLSLSSEEDVNTGEDGITPEGVIRLIKDKMLDDVVQFERNHKESTDRFSCNARILEGAITQMDVLVNELLINSRVNRSQSDKEGIRNNFYRHIIPAKRVASNESELTRGEGLQTAEFKESIENSVSETGSVRVGIMDEECSQHIGRLLKSVVDEVSEISTRYIGLANVTGEVSTNFMQIEHLVDKMLNDNWGMEHYLSRIKQHINKIRDNLNTISRLKLNQSSSLEEIKRLLSDEWL
jgi:hypothetical protein